MLEFLKSLFIRKPAEDYPIAPTVEPDRDFGFIDYDGMGNQGRFPVEKKKNWRKK